MIPITHYSTTKSQNVFLCTFCINSGNIMTIKNWEGIPITSLYIPNNIAISSKIIQARYIREKLTNMFETLIILYRFQTGDSNAVFTADTFRLLNHGDALFYNKYKSEWWDTWFEMIRSQLKSGFTKEVINNDLSKKNNSKLCIAKYWKDEDLNIAL